MRRKGERKARFTFLTFTRRLRIVQQVWSLLTEGLLLLKIGFDLAIVLFCSFVSRIDCVEMASENQLCGKGYELTLFLFTDILVVAKRKSNKTLSISRSPSTASLAGVGTLGHGQGLLQTKVKYHKLLPSNQKDALTCLKTKSTPYYNS